MKYVLKGLGAASLLALSFTQVNAATVNFTLSGTVNNTSGLVNIFTLSVGDTITATASFDDSLLGLNTSIDFSDPGISMIITVGNTVFNDADDFFGGARLDLGDGFFDDEIEFTLNDQSYWVEGLFYSSNVANKDFDSSSFCCDFSGDNFDGTWTSASVSAVPVPAAVWLFGSGLLGLVGVARRKAA